MRCRSCFVPAFHNTAFVLCALLALAVAPVSAEEMLLEDYASGGQFSDAGWANTFEDSEGKANAAIQEDEVAVIHWATKWSGFPSIGGEMDLTRFKSMRVDVMVAEGQPVEQGTNFYFQLLNKVDVGFSYWESFVPQTEVPADGKWYRITIPISEMEPVGGDGGDAPTDVTMIYGCTCGMTYDESGEEFKFKEARFDNVTLLTDEVEEAKVEAVPPEENQAEE